MKYVFFIGTEAELIKLFPIMIEMNNQNIPYLVISSGQNNISKSRVLYEANQCKIDCTLSDESNIKKNAIGLLRWFINTFVKGKKIIKKSIQEDLEGSIMIIHGDTVSTVMGALLGKSLKMKVAHIEAGLRSHNWFNPFPEEIDRVITSKFSDYSFAPGNIACDNLKTVKTKVVNTQYNTIVDSLKYSKKMECKDDKINTLLNQKYFVFVCHRQENLSNEHLVEKLVNKVIEKSKSIKCVLILHKITEITLKRLNLYGELLKNENIIMIPRVEYFDFMKLLSNSLFVITDGGSNQEELSYMGKPCLILRKYTERFDGIGENVILFNNDFDKIDSFFEEYESYNRKEIITELSPSKLIIDTLCK